MTTPTTPARRSDLKSRAADLWRDAIAGHPNEGVLLRGNVLGRVLDPAADAWQHAPAGDQQVLAAATVGWRFGYQHNVQAGIERAASTVSDDLRQARDRIAARPAGATALASAARQVGLDPDDPNNLQLHALADALALSGVDLAERDRQQQGDLTQIVQIAADVARSADTSPARLDPALPDPLATDVLGTGRTAAPAEPAWRLFAAVGLGWQAGMVIGEDVGAVYAVQHIAATAAQNPGLWFGRMTPAQWTEHTLRPVQARLEQRLGPEAAGRLWADATHAAAQAVATAPGPAPPPDDTTRSRASSAFGPLTAIDPAIAAQPGRPSSPASLATPTHRRRR